RAAICEHRRQDPRRHARRLVHRARVNADGDPLLDHAGLTADELNEVLRLVAATDIIQLEVTVGATRLSLRRPGNPEPASDSVPVQGSTAAESSALAIASPLVGVFRPAISAGESVSAGQ